jgi:hypothetical protein
MARFGVLVPDVPDTELGYLLAHLSDAGYDHPVVTRTDDRPPGQLALPGPRRAGADPFEDSDLPDSWDLIEERHGMTYRWPKYTEDYGVYRIFRASTGAEGIVHISLGAAMRRAKWGRDRHYLIAFLSAGAPLTPLVEFLEADDSPESREYLSVIRGKDGGRKMFGPGDTLPGAYARRFRTQMYGERVDCRGVWNKVVIVAHEEELTTILNHALLQARRRSHTPRG